MTTKEIVLVVLTLVLAAIMIIAFAKTMLDTPPTLYSKKDKEKLKNKENKDGNEQSDD